MLDGALADIVASSKSPEEKLSAQTAMAQLGKAAGLADVSSSLNAVRDGLAQVKDVEKNPSIQWARKRA